jgi:hypothetical protein
MEKPINRKLSSQKLRPESIQGKGSVESGVNTRQGNSSTSRSGPTNTFSHNDLEKGRLGERSKMKRPLIDPALPEAQRPKLPKPGLAPVEGCFSKEPKQEVMKPAERSEHSKVIEGSKEFAEMAIALQQILMGPKRRSTEEFMKDTAPKIAAIF